MSNKANDSFIVNAGGGWSYIARVRIHSGADATQATIQSISRSITNTVTKVVVTDDITVATAIYDALQTNAHLCAFSFNMKDDVPATKISDRVKYKVQYTITPQAGAVIKTREIDIEGD